MFNIFRKITQPIIKRIKLIKDYTEFKETMYDYNNINEYYSFYGKVIYISTDYYLNNDYFIILYKNDGYALVKISNTERQRFLTFTNRDNLIDELKKLENTVTYVTFRSVINYMNYELDNKFYHNDSKHELIKLEDNNVGLWNAIMLEGILKQHSIRSSIVPMTYNIRQVREDVQISHISIPNVYGTQFTFDITWVVNNDFMDICIHHRHYKMGRRLFIYDVLELFDLFKFIVHNDEHHSSIKIDEFCKG